VRFIHSARKFASNDRNFWEGRRQVLKSRNYFPSALARKYFTWRSVVHCLPRRRSQLLTTGMVNGWRGLCSTGGPQDPTDFKRRGESIRELEIPVSACATRWWQVSIRRACRALPVDHHYRCAATYSSPLAAATSFTWDGDQAVRRVASRDRRALPRCPFAAHLGDLRSLRC
jgi:hypothetical protein